MFDQFSVTAIGSCRVVNPMRTAAQAGSVRLCNGSVYGYMHAAREILQFLNVRDGTEVPPEIVPYLTGGRALTPRLGLTEPQVYLVEISSLKTVQFGDWVLQLNYFTDHFRAEPDLLRIVQGARQADQREARALKLVAEERFGAVDAFDRLVLLDAHVAQTTRSELELEVLEIVGRLTHPVVFVTHCNLPDARGATIESRAQIATWMAEFATVHGLRVFDPTPHALAFGAAAAMADEGGSRTHYTPAFEAVLTEALLAEIREAATQRATTREPASLPQPGAAPIRRHRVPLAAEAERAQLRAQVAGPLRAGNLDEAAGQARAALAAEPSFAPALSVLAQVALRRQEPETALALARAVRTEQARDAASLVTAAKALTKLKRFEEAAEAWQEMAACARNATWPLIEAARCLLRAKQPERSLGLAETALAREPSDPVALAVTAEALRMLGRTDALPPIAEALALTTPEAALDVLRWLIAAGHNGHLARIARRIHEAPRAVPEAEREDACRQLRAAAAHAVEQQFWETAAETLRALLVFAPEDRAAARTLAKLTARSLAPARSALQAGDLEGAALAYDVALRIDPDGDRTRREAASAAEKRAAWDRAADLWEQIGANDPSGRALTRAARAAELAGQEERALGLYGRAGAIEPDNAKTQAAVASLTRRLAKRARALEIAGAAEEAVRVAAVVLAVDPGDVVCTRIVRRSSAHLAQRLRQAVADGDAARQETLAVQLLRLDPQRFEALRVLSKARLAGGQLDEAADLLRRLTVVQSDVAAHWIKLGRCLRLMKSYDAARDAAEQALVRDPASPAAHKILEALGERRAP